MNLRKKMLAVVAAATIGWSVVANADEPNYAEAQNIYFQVLGEIHNHCVLLWTYDPAPSSNYGICVFDQKYQWSQVMYLAASIYAGQYYPDGTNVGLTYGLVANTLFYGT